MSLVVVRCPACLGASQIESDALGQMVGCPRCQVPFVAAEEIVPTVQPVNRSRHSAAVPVAPAPRRRRRPLQSDEPPQPESAPPPADQPKVPDPEHDPHLPPVAGLPVSVLVGLALLPFGIPVLWWATPTLTGQEAALSLAVPISLALAASTLCLGVVYTIDWTATTRIKGVLMLVILAYMSAAGLFFLKKDLMDRVRNFFEPESPWRMVVSKDKRFRVRLRGSIDDAKTQPLPQAQMSGQQATLLTHSKDRYHYLAMDGVPDKPVPDPNDAWYDAVGKHLATQGRVTDHHKVKLWRGGHPGHQWTLEVGEDYRVVQVYVVNGRVYYLSVEGRNVTPTEPDFAEPFFQSFEIMNAKI